MTTGAIDINIAGRIIVGIFLVVWIAIDDRYAAAVAAHAAASPTPAA